MTTEDEDLGRAIALLRALSYRITAADTATLPRVVAHACNSLLDCRPLLAQAQSLRQKDGEAGLVLHRFNTQITSFLHARSPQERWAAAVLIKAAVEAGRWDILTKSAAWVTALTNNLKKSAPPSTINISIITVTRIFTLTWDNPSLIRDITTPTLPGFLTTCLALATSKSCPSSTLTTVLQSCITLIPRHPIIFRSFSDSLNNLAVNLITTPAQPNFTKQLADRILVLLHSTNPKEKSVSSWEAAFAALITQAHHELDNLFEGVIEQWRPLPGLESVHKPDAVIEKNDTAQRVNRIYASSEILANTLRRLSSYITTSTTLMTNIKLGLLENLLSRLSATAGSLSSACHALHFAPDVTRTEQLALLSILPTLHLGLLQLINVLIQRHQDSLLPILHSLLDQVCWIYQAESADLSIRSAVYDAVRHVVDIVGPSMTKETVAPILPIATACCLDLNGPASDRSQIQSQKPTTQINADTMSKKSTASDSSRTTRTNTNQAAWTLLPVLLSRLSSLAFPAATRALMDRTAILTRHKQAIIASTLNPPALRGIGSRAASSLLPLAAREFPSHSEVEALLRPRMPVIRTTRRANNEQDTSDADMDEDANVSDCAPASQNGNVLDTILDAVSRKRIAEDLDSSSKRPRAGSPDPYGGETNRLDEYGSSAAVSGAKIQPHILPGAQVPALDTGTVEDVATNKTVPFEEHNGDARQTVSSTANVGPTNADTGDEDEDFVMPDLDLRSSESDDDDDNAQD